HPWRIDSCPMSSEAFAEGPAGVLAAWETAGQVYFASIKQTTLEATAAVAPPGPGKGRKHPALAVNRRGETIVVWTEGTGWQRGGALAWQVHDADGQPGAEKGLLPRAIPVLGLATARARTDGGLPICR